MKSEFSTRVGLKMHRDRNDDDDVVDDDDGRNVICVQRFVANKTRQEKI